MKIVIASSEVAPFATTGGLGDVVGALPKALKRLGLDCYVLMPKYKEIDDERFGLKLIGEPLTVPISNNKIIQARIYTAFMDMDIPVYFIENRDYFYRDWIYGTNGKDYPDNAERFTFFSKGCLSLLKKIGIYADIIHCNDWHTALIPIYLKTLCKDDEFFKNLKTLFTIHNVAYQGIFDYNNIDLMGLPHDTFTIDGIEYYGKINLLKAGIIFSDIITTVSKTYAKEIQTERYGCGLDGILRRRKDNLYGIINGIDYNDWNPAKDRFIIKQYSIDDLSGKEACKKDLLSIYGLEFKRDIPVIGIVSRLDEQKGFDLIEEIMDELMEWDMQICILGIGKERYHKFLYNLADRHREKVGVRIAFDNPLAHKITAGADIFLMPSRYEPCGLSQLHSQKYGTIPVVRDTGGLADTIKEYDPVAGNGNGFKFLSYTRESFLNAIRSAINLYNDREKWQKLMKNAMKEDHSWERSAREYLRLYQRLSSENNH